MDYQQCGRKIQTQNRFQIPNYILDIAAQYIIKFTIRSRIIKYNHQNICIILPSRSYRAMNVLCRVLAEEKPKSLQAATNELITQEKKQL